MSWRALKPTRDVGVGDGFFTIPQYFEPALALMADQLLHPAYPQAALDRIKANAIARLRRLQDQPEYLAGRVLANAVYGAGHPTSEQNQGEHRRDYPG